MREFAETSETAPQRQLFLAIVPHHTPKLTSTALLAEILSTNLPSIMWSNVPGRPTSKPSSPSYSTLHDNDGIFGQFGSRKPGKSGRSYHSTLDLWLGEVLRIKGIPIPYGAPNAQAHIERFMGSLRRECLNHFLFFSEDHLCRTFTAYVAYYNGGRPHQGIEGIPEFGPGSPRATPSARGDGSIKIIARPVLGGLHHDYRRAA